MTVIRSLALPLDFETAVYRRLNADLAHMTEAELIAHHRDHGAAEGRRASSICTRADLVALIPGHLQCLEIGPFDRPCLDPSQADFVDVLDRDGLRARAAEIGRDPDGVPEIRWVSTDGSLGLVSDEYDLVLSSHSIEHQIDLVRHLAEVERILRTGGHYVCIISDSRYCFDHFLPPSTISDVLAAHVDGRHRHSLKSIVDDWAMTTHNDAVRHWAGDHGSPGPDVGQVRKALEAWNDPDARPDVHAWRFTPDSFRSLVGTLGELGLTKLGVERLYPTLHNTLEFFAVLRHDA